MNKRKRIKLGDIFMIPLPNGKFAYARKYDDASIAIYKHIGTGVSDLPTEEEYQFFVRVYEDVLKSGNWPIIDNRPFKSKEEAYPPPTRIKDPISGKFSIYYNGEIRDATEKECEGLEVTSIWEAEHVIDRIMGNDKWNKLIE